MTHLGAALKLLFERPVASVVGALALALGLVLIGLAVWLLDVTGGAEAAVERDVILRARLDPKLDQAATEKALLALGAVSGVRQVEWVGPEAQKAELTAVLGADLLEGLDGAVFPKGGLAKVTLERGVVSDRGALDQLLAAVERIDDVDGVEAVPFDPRHLAFLFDAAAVGRIVGMGLALLALIAGALAIYQRVALALHARDAELGLYRAFGATERWLMARYFALALVIGAAAAGIAIVVALIIHGPLSDLASLIPGGGGRGVLAPWFLGVAVVGALGLASVSGYLAVARERRRR